MGVIVGTWGRGLPPTEHIDGFGGEPRTKMEHNHDSRPARPGRASATAGVERGSRGGWEWPGEQVSWGEQVWWEAGRGGGGRGGSRCRHLTDDALVGDVPDGGPAVSPVIGRGNQAHIFARRSCPRHREIRLAVIAQT